MKRMSLLLLGAAVLLVTGCSSVKIANDWDPGADFTGYRKYAWIAQPVGSQDGSVERAIASNTLLDERIKRAVNVELGLRGMIEDINAPDILVVYHTGVDDKVNITNYGYTYGNYWAFGAGGGGNVSVQHYKAGTLIVDLVDAGTKQLVWRGSAEGSIEGNPTPEQAQKNVADAITKMMKKYPPPAK
jgi:hypothetical protein